MLSQVKLCNMSCCIVEKGIQCTNTAITNVPIKKLQKALSQSDSNFTMKMNIQTPLICSYHKEAIQASRQTRRKRRAVAVDTKPNIQRIAIPPQAVHPPLHSPPSPVDDTNIMDNLELELGHLQLGTLRKCRKYFNLQTRAGTNRQQLAENIIKHFRNMPVKEKEVIDNFLKAVMKRQNDTNDDNTDR